MPAPTHAPELERFELDPITVTAQALESSARRAPASVTTFSSETLAIVGAESTADLRIRAPNLVVQDAGSRRSNFFSIRGLGNTPIANSSVGIYVDGIPIVDQRAALIPLFDVEGVEVLRGPQNLRFGRSADGGAINVVTRRPESEPSVRASVQYGNFDTQIYEAAGSSPLGSDRAAIRIAGLKSSRDGYIDNTLLDESLDDRDLLAGRGTLLLFPVPELEIALIGEAQSADDGSRALVLGGQSDPFEVAYNIAGSERNAAYLGALRIDYADQGLRVTSRTARRSFTGDRGRFDLDQSPQDLLLLIDDHSYVDWTEEVRLSYVDPADRWRGALGFFFEEVVTKPVADFQANDTAFVQAPPPVGLGLPFTAPVSDSQRARLDTRTLSGFGEVSTTWLAPLEITVGLRYQYDDVEMERTHVIDARVEGTAVSVVPPIDLDTSSSAWLPQLTAAYRFRPLTFIYATVTRGYRSAGFSHLIDDPAAARFGAQREWSWETGFKGSWLDGMLDTDLSLFYILAHDFQVARRSGFTSFRVLNADQVTSRGLEASLVAEPWPGLDFIATVGYIDARYDDLRAPDGAELDGNDLQLVPPYNFSLAAQYRHPAGLVGRVEYQGVGSYEFTEDNDGGQDAYELLDARIGWTSTHFGVFAFARNLTDETYFPFAIPGGPGGEFIVTPGAPRTFGMIATATF